MNKLTKGTALATAVCGLLISAPAAYAKHDDEGWEYAKVVRAEPIYREVRVSEPRRVCSEEPVTTRTVYRNGPADPGAVVLGAVIGGVIGHQFGGGHGRDVATAAGALIGANHVASQGGYGRRVVERETYETRCETVRAARYEDELEGYDVTYRYHGRLYHTHTAHDPGARIRVRVDVAPYEDDLD